MTKFPHYTQTDAMTCGPTCLRILSAYYGVKYSLADLVKLSQTTREGSTLLGISNAAEKIGFRTLGIKISFDKLVNEAPFPFIAHWNQNHFVVVYKIKKNIVYISDPAHGLLQYSKEEFIKSWVSDGKDEGILLLLETTPEFYEEAIDKTKEKRNKSVIFIFNYLKSHRKSVIQLCISLLAGFHFSHKVLLI
jgi:ATP-binding cassette subfamily B protein